jgi:hypothetical protein
MEVIAPNQIKLRVDERIYELIQLIKPTHEGESCSFLEGPLWATSKTTYREKLVHRSYWLINHHLYAIYKIDGPRTVVTYWRVSGRGNVNEITREDAVEVVNTRVGYVEDSALMELPPNDDPAIPYQTVNCDW